MALIVNLKTVEYLKGKYDRIVRITFRGKTLQSNVVNSAKRVAYFGQSFEWPIARPIEISESLELLVFNFSKYLSDKLIGSYILILQQLVQDGHLSISESLVDRNNKVIPVTITFEVNYVSPDGQVGNWAHRMSQQFDYPISMEGQDESALEAEEKALLASVNLLQVPEEDENDVTSLTSDHLDDDMGSGVFIMENSAFDKKSKSAYVDLQLDRPKDFEIMITIIEGQQLSGLDIDPVVKVEVGSESKYTSIRQSNNCPYYNEYFVFNFNEMPAILFDKIITITAYHSYALPGRHIFKVGNIVAAKKLIGQFRCDLGTVYMAPDHQFYHKWAVLMDPKELEAGPKGYIKCDIAITAKGQAIKVPKSMKETTDTDNIEGNLLLPAGITKTRHRAVYTINIYKAEELPQTDVGIMASVQKAFTRKDVAFIDACVRVSFVGQIGKTSVIKSYYPEWNESLKFMDMFPPLCNRIKVQLCDQDVLSADAVATHFIELSQIMDPGSSSDGILPTFGPCWVNMYGTGRAFKMMSDGTEDLNEGMGEGSAFRGRLLMSLRTSVDPTEMATEGGSKVIKEKLRTGLSEHSARKQFLLFSTFFEASMIDAKLSNKSIHFEISIGQYGNTLDAKATAIAPLGVGGGDDDDDGGTAGVPALKQQLLKKQRDEEATMPCLSTTPRKVIKLTNKNYGYLPIEEEKPCLFVVSLFEDVRKRHYHSNALAKMADALEDGLDDVKERLSRQDPDTYKRLRGAMEKLKIDCDAYLKTPFGVGAGSGKTKLDQYRLKSCKKFIEKLRDTSTRVKKSTTRDTVRKCLQEVRDVPYKLKNMSKDPQHSLPDILIWMVCDNERVAYHRLPAREIIYTTEEHLVGRHCGKRQTIFLKKPGKKNLGQQGWMIQAKLNIFMWLGELDQKSNHYMDGLPKGFEPVYASETSTLPPVVLNYTESHRFQVRAYLFQARSLIPSDDTGLSDPFARVIVCNQCATTQIIEETLSPTWDETLILDDILLYGDALHLKASPPLVIVEIYDYDTVGQPEFLGRTTTIPKFRLADEMYIPAKLQWWDVHRGPNRAGQLLASFEFIEGYETSLPLTPPFKESNGKVLMSKEKVPLYSIPTEIKPAMSRHRLEILYRGVRDLKRIQLMTVDHPHIAIDCSGQIKHSDRIIDMDKNCNFECYITFMDIDLPDDKLFWPPLTIRCLETRSFGRTLLVGVHTIENIEKFIHKTKKAIVFEEDEEDDDGDDDQSGGGTREPSLANGRASSIDDNQSRHTTKTAKTTAASGKSKLDQEQKQESTSKVLSVTSGETKASKMSAAAVKTPHDPGLNEDGISEIVEHDDDDDDGGGGGGSGGKKTFKRLKTKKKKSKPVPELTPEEETAQRARIKELVAELDWWSKYHVSKEESVAEQHEYLMKKKARLSYDANQENYGLGIIDYTALDMGALDKQVEEAKKRALEAERLEQGKKKKKRKKLTRKRMKKKMAKLKGQMNVAFKKDEGDDDDDDDVMSGEEDNSYIQRFKVYACGLEDVPEFHKFEKFFRTFQLYRGKKADDEAEDFDRFSGLFKGQFSIYKLEESDQIDIPMPQRSTLTPPKLDDSIFKLTRYLPPHKPVEVKVFVYVVKATDLHPVDFDGRSDPYLILKCGRDKTVDKENKIENQLNPVFGRMFDFDAVFPMDSMLKIEVWDYDAIGSDDLIGETTIDLEDRYFTHHMARCALQSKYELYGYNVWRNPLRPSQLLENLCTTYGFDQPVYSPDSLVIGDFIKFVADGNSEKYEVNENGDLRPTTEHLALKALHNWHTVPGGWPLVPEHVETRPLFCDARPGIEQGRLEMWIDMFPKDSPKLPACIDISPRQPKKYELRCIVWNTDEVTLDDVNALTGEASSDIFVKGFLKGVGVDDMKTDTHYRSLTGEGNFNWRFIFKFDYLKAENKVVYMKKDHILATDEVEHKTPPNLSVQVWDADLVTADDFLGSIVLNLLKVPRPAKKVEKCSLKMVEPGSKHPTLNLFKNKRCKGWWPVSAREKPEKDDDDDDDDDDEEEDQLILKGKVELELELLTEEDAEKTPVGIAHEEPEGLPKPNRPDTSFLWFMNPLKTLKYIIWKNYKWLIIKLLILAIIIIFLVLFFYNFPGAIVQKIVKSGN